MDKDKKWMLITYYCPTHGNDWKIEPIQLPKHKIANKLFNKNKSKKDIY